MCEKCIQRPITNQAPSASTERHSRPRGHFRPPPGQFGRVPSWLLRHRGVKARALQVYALLAAEHANRHDHTCYPSRRTIAIALGVSRSTVDVALAQLKAAGAITVQHRRDAAGDPTSNLYTLLQTAPEPPDDAAGIPKSRASGVPVNPAQNQNQGNTSTSGNSSARCAPTPPPLAAVPKRRPRPLEPSTIAQVRLAIWYTFADPSCPDNDPDVADAVRQLLKARGSTSAEDGIRAQIDAVRFRRRQLSASYHPGATWRQAGPSRPRQRVAPPANRWQPVARL